MLYFEVCKSIGIWTIAQVFAQVQSRRCVKRRYNSLCINNCDIMFCADSSVSNQAQQNDVVIDEKQAALFVHNPVGGEEVGVTASKEVTLKPVSSFESFNNEQNFSKAVEEETDDVIAPLRGSAASASTKSGIPVAIPYTSSLSSSSSSIQGPVSKASTKRKVRSKDLIDRFTSDYFLDPTLRMSKCLSYTFDLKSLTSEDGKSQGERQSSPTPRIQAPYAYAARLLSYLQSSISPRVSEYLIFVYYTNLN